MRRATTVIALMAIVIAACAEGAVAPTTAPGGAAPTVATTTTTAAADPTTTSTTAATDPTTTTTVAAGALADVGLALETVASGFEQPVFLAAPPGDSRLFVLDQPGRLWVIGDGDPEVFLDLRDDVRFGGEQGLLGLAFHPDYADNGRFFVNYTDAGGDTVIAEYRASSDATRADAASRRVLLTVAQPDANHNGGMIAFGPDGSSGSAWATAAAAATATATVQRADTLLGSMLRIDVDGGDPYAVPADNPYAAGGGAPEVWATGLRNPWRFSFDGDLLYIGDVGQGRIEEVDRVETSSSGLNFGWSRFEGTSCFSGGCDPTGLVAPVHEYGHDQGCSITGGYVYRGTAIPELDGHYFFTDWCTGFLRTIAPSGDVVDWTDDVGALAQVSSFGIDGQGELYVVSATGTVSCLDRATS